MHVGGKIIGSSTPNWHTDWLVGKMGKQEEWACNWREAMNICFKRSGQCAAMTYRDPAPLASHASQAVCRPADSATFDAF